MIRMGAAALACHARQMTRRRGGKAMATGCSVEGNVAAALFTLRVHRGEGMALLAMNWRNGQPPDDFVGFAIEYQEPGGNAFFAVKNRLTFEGNAGSLPPASRPPSFSTLVAPIQK